MRLRGGPRGRRNARVGVEYTAAYQGAVWRTVRADVVTHAIVGVRLAGGSPEVLDWCDGEAKARRRIEAAWRIPVWAALLAVPVQVGARTTAERPM